MYLVSNLQASSNQSSMDKPEQNVLSPIEVFIVDKHLGRNRLTKPCASKSSEEIMTDINLTHTTLLVAWRRRIFKRFSYARTSNVL
jgi:hypothetical protein